MLLSSTFLNIYNFIRFNDIPRLCRLHLPTGSFLSELYKIAVFFIAFEQFFVCTATDSSPVKYHNFVCIPNGLEPVSDHNHCLIFCQSIKSCTPFSYICQLCFLFFSNIYTNQLFITSQIYAKHIFRSDTHRSLSLILIYTVFPTFFLIILNV